MVQAHAELVAGRAQLRRPREEEAMAGLEAFERPRGEAEDEDEEDEERRTAERCKGPRAGGVSSVLSPSVLSMQSSRSSGSITNAFSDDDASPFVAHYHKFSEEDLCLHVSIAQGGLQRIRREALSAQVSLKDITEMFGSSIARLAAANDLELQQWGRPEPATCFAGTSRPRISVGDYLWRIVRALNAHSEPALFASDGSDLSELAAVSSPPPESASAPEDSRQLLEGENSAMGRGLRCLLLAFVYIDRACESHPAEFRVTSLSVHRILLTAIYVATKFTDDTLPRAHATFAKLGGVSRVELKRLEEAFCALVGFRFYVTEAEFQAHCMEQLRCAVRSVRHLKQRAKPLPPIAKQNYR